jgi:hypothetical protein
MAAGGADATFADDFISGIEDGLAWANLEAKHRYGQYLYCLPEEIGPRYVGDPYVTHVSEPTHDQKITMMRQYVAKYPIHENLTVGLALINALVEAFPCPK